MKKYILIKLGNLDEMEKFIGRYKLSKLTLEEIGKLNRYKNLIFSSVQFSRSVVSDSLRPHESQHTRPPCPSPPTPGAYSDSCP